jgi:hypothetical protein
MPPFVLRDFGSSTTNQSQLPSMNTTEVAVNESLRLANISLPYAIVWHIMDYFSMKDILGFRVLCKWSHWLVSKYDFGSSLIPISRDSDEFTSKILAEIRKHPRPSYFSWSVRRLQIDDGMPERINDEYLNLLKEEFLIKVFKNQLPTEIDDDRVHSLLIRPLVPKGFRYHNLSFPTDHDYILNDSFRRFKNIKVLALSGMEFTFFSSFQRTFPRVTSLLIWNCYFPIYESFMNLGCFGSLTRLYLEFSYSKSSLSKYQERQLYSLPINLGRAKFCCFNSPESVGISISARSCKSLKRMSVINSLIFVRFCFIISLPSFYSQNVQF